MREISTLNLKNMLCAQKKTFILGLAQFIKLFIIKSEIFKFHSPSSPTTCGTKESLSNKIGSFLKNDITSFVKICATSSRHTKRYCRFTARHQMTDDHEFHSILSLQGLS